LREVRHHWLYANSGTRQSTIKKERTTKEGDFMGKIRRVSSIAGVLAVISYMVFGLLAFLRYPVNYSPMTNWLSDLGSSTLNPDGALFYNIGIILTGLLVLLFFIGLSGLRIPGNRKQYAMLLVTQGFGVLGSFSLIMSAIYPINFLEAHRFWSISLYIMLGTAFAFSVSALRYYPAWPRWLLAFGVLVAAVDILSGVCGSSYVMEWITVALFLFYICAVALKTVPN
jgi:hypothetical membrane protein